MARAQTILVVGTFVTAAVVFQAHLGGFVGLQWKLLLARLLRRFSFFTGRGRFGRRHILLAISVVTRVEILHQRQIELWVIHRTAATFCPLNDALGSGDDTLSYFLLSYLLNMQCLQRLAQSLSVSISPAHTGAATDYSCLKVFRLSKDSTGRIFETASTVRPRNHNVLVLLLLSVDVVLQVQVRCHVLATLEKLLCLNLAKSDSFIHLCVKFFTESIFSILVNYAQMSLEICDLPSDCLVPCFNLFFVKFISGGLNSPGLLISFLLAQDFLLAAHVQVGSWDSKLDRGSLFVRLLMQDVLLLLAFEERLDLSLIFSLSLQNFSVPSLFELGNQFLGFLIEWFALFVQLLLILFLGKDKLVVFQLSQPFILLVCFVETCFFLELPNFFLELCSTVLQNWVSVIYASSSKD